MEQELINFPEEEPTEFFKIELSDMQKKQAQKLKKMSEELKVKHEQLYNNNKKDA